MNNLYYRLCKGLNTKGKLYPITESMYDHIDDYEKDWYFSTYLYNEEQKKEIETEVEETKDGKTYKTIKGVSGITNVKSNKICFDFDSHDNLELARQDTIKLIDKLVDEGIPKSEIQICFSGNKGFSVLIETSTYFNPDEIKRIASFLTSDLDTFDSKIYNASRVFRVPLTKHQETGYYKYPCIYDQLVNKTIDEIKEFSKVNTIVDPKDYKDYFTTIDLPEKIINLKNLVKQKDDYKEKLELISKIENIDFNNRPVFLTPSKYILHLGNFIEGERSHAAMILAATYKKAGFSKTDAYRLLKSVMERQAEINKTECFSKEELWNNVIKVVYNKNWNGGIYNEDSSDLLAKINLSLPFYLRDDQKNSSLVDNGYILESFKKFLDDIDKNTLRFGIKSLDKKIKLLTGTTCSLLGVPSSGKSACGMSLLSYNSQMGEPSIYYSLDMSSNVVVYRVVQMITSWNDDKIKDTYHNNNKLFMEKYNEGIEKYFKNVNYSFKYGLTPDDIRNDIVNFQERTGKKIRLVLVDYLENVSSSYADPVVSAGVVSQMLANVAAELNVLIVILMQTQKTINPTEEITSLRSIKGSSVIEQSVSVALGISRLGHSSKYVDYDTSMTVNIIKNRFGNLGKDYIGWSGESVKIRELNEQDRLNIAEIERLKQEEKEEQEQQRQEAWRNRSNNNWG